jgi:hypothetical protein
VLPPPRACYSNTIIVGAETPGYRPGGHFLSARWPYLVLLRYYLSLLVDSIHSIAEKKSSRKLEGPRAQEEEEEGVWCNRLGFALVQSYCSGVEAKNFVLYVGTWGEGSQWCDRLPLNGGGPSGGAG